LPWLAVLVPVGIGAVVHVVFQARTDIWRVGPQPATLLTVPVLSFIAVHLLGLAALPLLTWPGRREWPALGMALVAMLGFAWVVSVASGRSGGVFPYLGNWITPFGSFDENSIQPGTRPLMAGWNVRLVLTLVGCLCGAILLTRLVAWRREGTPGSLLAALTLFHLPFLAIAPAVYDRYFLVLLPGTLALCASEDRHPGWGVPALVVSGLLSLGLAHDLLAWNRAVWRLGQRAVASGIAPEFIEGGFTWNGWHAPAAARDKTPRPPAGLALPFTRRFFPTVVGRYAISFSSLPGTRVLDRESYRLWMIPGEQQMVFLEAEP